VDDDADPAELDGLVARAQGGDREAFHALILATHREVRLFVAGRAWSLEMVEEIVQAAYVAAFESLATYRREGMFLPWLKGIAHNRLRKEARERARFDRMPAGAADLVGGVPAVDADADDDGEERRRSETQRLQGCLERLSPRARDILERHYAKGLPLAVLAQQFKQTRQAIANALHRTRAALRECASEPR
jgi:RNA polymerase sigma-70 factor, ECF subfamily